MSRSINSDKSWNSTDEEFDDCDNSSTSNSINRRISGDDIPGGCITTHSVSSVIRPGSKMPRNDPLQFVKIQNNELSKKVSHQKVFISLNFNLIFFNPFEIPFYKNFFNYLKIHSET